KKVCTLESGQKVCVSTDDPDFGCDDPLCAACYVPHAASRICSTDGKCTYGSCQPGYQHCPGSTSNGCDSQSASDVHNCGMCRNDCEVLRMTTSTAVHVLSTKCANGMCQTFVCETGWRDCNGALTDGCECGPNKACSGTQCVAAGDGGV